MPFDAKDPNYLKYCRTPQQEVVLKAVAKEPNRTKAAKALGKGRSYVQRTLQSIEGLALRSGYDPEHGLTHASPPSQVYQRGTFHVKDGEVVQYWSRLTKDGEAAQIIADALDRYEPTPVPPVAAPIRKMDGDLLNLFTLTDFHLGMYACASESGEDWTTEAAGRVLMSAIRDMITRAPSAATAIVNFQGDTLHWDGLESVTPSSHHVLDADTRFCRMVELVMTLTEWAVLEVLKTHQHVHVITCEGNHDMAGSGWLRKHQKRIWRDNPRVTVDDVDFPYYAYLHGRVMLGFHHGHKRKIKNLLGLFASEPRFREMWGKARYAYIHTGHYHSSEKVLDEYDGGIVERHPTLAARDAYAARSGYVARRAAHVITYDLDGEVDRSTVTPR